MGKQSKIPFSSRNHTGWWIFKEVTQWVSNRQKKLSLTSRCLVWENTRLICARNREQAYQKALKLGRLGHPSKTKGGEWRFVGISMLLPVYEEIEDGAEILWTEYGALPIRTIKKLAKKKRQLSVFDDKDR
jgi:uncharacterized protein DUF4288